MISNAEAKPTKAPWFKDPALKDPKEWGVAFLAVVVCYLAGESFAWLFGIHRSEPILLMHILQRMIYGMFLMAPIGVVSIGLLTGKWPWQKMNSSES